MKLLLNPIMLIVSWIRKERYNYLSVPEDVLSWVKQNNIMKIGHLLPSIVLTLIIVLKVLPLLSTDFVVQLELNAPVVPVSIIVILVPLLVLNGIIVELALESSNKEYKEYKANNK